MPAGRQRGRNSQIVKSVPFLFAVQVCSALKANKKIAQIPVIVFSSNPAAEITAYAECKAAYFVLKGTTSITDLPSVIASVLAPGVQRNLIVET